MTQIYNFLDRICNKKSSKTPYLCETLKESCILDLQCII